MSGTDRGGTPPRQGGATDYEAMRRDIRRSQARIDDTLDALRRRAAGFAPKHLMETTMNRIDKNSPMPNDDVSDRYGASRYGAARHQRGRSSSVGGTLLGHPVPLAMIGIGLGWLALSGSGYDRRIARSETVRSMRHRAGDAAQYARDTFYGATDSARDMASHAYDRASSAASDAYDRASGAAGDIYDRASGAMGDASDRARHYGDRAYDSVRSTAGRASSDGRVGRGWVSRERLHDAGSGAWEMVEDHPLVAGVLGLALGAALGASIPSTRYEDRWVGDYADEAADRARELAEDAVDRGTRAARAAVEAAKEEAGDAVSAATDAAREEARKPS